ncbi:hypothetical protein V493_00461 [Pseudogymnoascus sp. VKM F-4281 (FW-2241)]|nr:hypothetical protein V493_00461 [Pseudogymnoascus sp. VKM F-4281 (FW-2241)]
MSFGFSVGDFITVLQLAFKIRQEFVDAPIQFKAVSDEVRTLSIVLQDAVVALQNRELDTKQRRDLEDIDKGCRNVLDELQRILNKNIELSPESGVVGKRIKRVWKRLYWKQEDIDQLRSRVITNISLLDAFNGRLTRDNVVKLVQHQEDQGRQTVLNWLTPIDFATQQSDFISRRETGTGQWLLESTEFQAWVKTGQQALFCPGIPGAGKTILTSIVVDYLNANFQKDTNIGIAYLYCNFRRQNEQNAEGLLASLLKQLAQGLYPLPESVKSLYNSHEKNRTRPAFNELSSTLQSVAALYSRSFIVVDALDECQTSGGCRTKLLTEIFALQSKSRAGIFSTSRFIPEIEVQFKNGMRLEIQASDHDVQRYLDSHMSELPTCVLRNSELQGDIKAAIVNAVKGMFLLAQLHFDSLKDKKSPKAIRTALKGLSTGNNAYDDAYNDAMERIEGQLAGEKQLAKQVLSWITCAKRPLTTSELEHALAVELGESQFDEENLSPIEDMVSVCAGLVTVDEESAIIRWFPDAENDITKICLTYISFKDFEIGICRDDEELEERLQSNPLYDYASHNWGLHARKGFTLIPEIINFLQTKAQVEASSQALFARKSYLGYSQRFARQMTGLHLAAYFGLQDAVNSSLQTGLAANLVDSYGRTPLSWAAGCGHEAVAQLLLNKGAELDAEDEDSYSEYSQRYPRRMTGLHLAAYFGVEMPFNVFHEIGLISHLQDSYGRTPLSWAAGCGHEAVAQLLLNKGAEVDAKNKNGETPLYLAAQRGHKAVAQLLLNKGAEVDAKNKDGETPLNLAAVLGHEVVAQLLLNKGAEVDAKDTYGWTPLSWAASSGHEAVAQLLLNKGAEVDAKNKNGETPLYLAAQRGHRAVAQLLLNEGAEVDAKDEDGLTPLSVVAMRGHEAVAQLLLNKGAEVDAEDEDGWTPLSWAASSGHEAVAQLLLNKGAEVDAKNKNGETPLYLAAQRGHKAVAQLLLNKGAEVDAKDEDGLTPLSLAAVWGHEAVAQLLLNEGAEVDAEDSFGRTPLSWAAERGHMAVVQLLLKRGALVVGGFYGLIAIFTL